MGPSPSSLALAVSRPLAFHHSPGNCTGGAGSATRHAVAVASAESVHAVAVTTSFDSSDVVQAAVDLAEKTLAEDPAQLVARHEDHLDRFWTASGVDIDDELLCQAWYRNLYFFRCISKPGVACPGLYAGMVSAFAGWHGGHTMNYNAQQTYWTPFASNHLELAEPYVQMIAD